MALSPARLGGLMTEALELASRGALRVEPNPPVGAVIVSAGGDVVGRGWHAAYGSAHAEPVALADAGDAAAGGTLVVTLEPCAHATKKTPPCVEAIRSAGIRRVVAGAPDPNPATRGRAAEQLRAAGIAYADGPLREACEARIARYVRQRREEIPWTIAKWAMTADGHTADAAGRSRWITGEEARCLVHELRGRVEAVVVGRGTVDADDPELTCRLVAPPCDLPPAIRVFLDSRLTVSTTVRLVRSARDVPTLALCTPTASHGRRAALEKCSVEVAVVEMDDDGRVGVRAALELLHRRGVRRVLLESGGRLTGAALRAGVVHQVLAFTAPVVVGGVSSPGPVKGTGWAMAEAPRLEEPRVIQVGADSLLEGYWPREA